MEIAEEKGLRTVKLSEVKDLGVGRYIVEPCDSPECLYKAFVGVDTTDVVLIIEIDSRFMGIQKNIYLKFELRNWQHNRKAEAVNLFTDGSMPVGAIVKSTGHGHHRNSLMAELTIQGVAVTVDLDTRSTEIVEKDGRIKLEVYGCAIEPGAFLDSLDQRAYQTGDNMSKAFVTLLSSNVRVGREVMSKYILNSVKPVDFIIDMKKCADITKTMKAVVPFYSGISDTLTALAFKMFAERTKKAIDGVKMSVVFNKMFSGITDQAEFEKKCATLVDALYPKKDENYWSVQSSDFRSFLSKVFEACPDARELKKEALKRRQTGAINKMMEDLDFITCDATTHPLAHEATFSGTIPIGIFFRKKDDTYFLYNDNWDLWEEMLSKYPEEAVEIAKLASGRSTYEKDIMSYFYFTLHALPEYLERHTGKKWTGMPKIVKDAEELEPPTEGDNGVAKTRSALTPIVDNEALTVTVPYVAMKMYGQQTSYCYGLDFNVLTRGFTYKGNTVTKDIETRLNGADDYGLMFYTLTGSDSATGYPTFLIIFERVGAHHSGGKDVDVKTVVHFHRVHPTRSKNGDYNPVHNWTRDCYKWMIGNVPFESIAVQQGDLAFIKLDTPLDGDMEEVNSYDSHMFRRPVKFMPYTKKDRRNSLGYVRVEHDTALDHTHHEPRTLLAGDYEILQCRSWEANPRGIWSLRID